MNAEARWVIAAGLAPNAAPPDYLDLIDASPLASLHPDAVTMIQRP